MTTAVEIVTDAMGWLNKLYPGETLNADDLATGFSRLNSIVDTMSAQKQFLYKTVITSAAQAGHITLAAGSWAAIPAGTRIVSVNVDGREITPVTGRQYAEIYDATATGSPDVWHHDGMSTIYLYPVANGQTVEVLTETGVATFADTTTSYTMPPGYKAALGLSLAVSMAPTLNPGLLTFLLREKKAAMGAITSYKPEPMDFYSYTDGRCVGNITNGWA